MNIILLLRELIENRNAKNRQGIHQRNLIEVID